MAESKSANPVILKILNGAQAGVEVVLHDGTVLIGSGSGDDVQLIDVSLKPNHARLRVLDGKVEIMADAGPLRTSAGLSLAPNSDWQAVEPLDVITAGTMRFALGPASAHWDSISDADADLVRPSPQAVSGAPAPMRGVSLRTLKISAIPAALLVLLCLFGIWVVLGSPTHLTGRQSSGSPLEQTRAALDQFPFGRDIETRREVDGTIYVNGYVETPVERRALANALEQTGQQQRVRIWVLENIRSEVAALLKSRKTGIGFDLTPQGNLTLTGIDLDKDDASRLLTTVRDSVFGLHDVESHIRTAGDFLADVRKLVEASQLQTWLLLRLDGDLIEINGALPVDKVDAWVGFLQSFAKTYAKDIALRSFVQLQTPGGQLVPAGGRAIAIGGSDPSRQDTSLDVDKLKGGKFTLGDVFVGKVDDRARPLQTAVRADAPAASGSGASADSGDGAGAGRRRPDGDASGSAVPRAADQAGAATARGVVRAADTTPQPAGVAPAGATGPAGAAGTPGAPGTAGAAANGGVSPAGVGLTATGEGPAAAAGAGGAQDSASPIGAAGPAATSGAGAGPGAGTGRATTPGTSSPPASLGDGPSDVAGRTLAVEARALIQRWRDGTLGTDPGDVAVKDALDMLDVDAGGSGPAASTGPDGANWFVPLFSAVAVAGTEQPCWSDAQVRPGNLPAALFWLDLLSVTDKRTITTFPTAEQMLLLEVAMNPSEVRACAGRSPGAQQAASHSLYLKEIRRNPSFIRFIVRDLPAAGLDISGVDFSHDRFVLTRAGLKMHEGSAPDRTSRIALVGELGAVIQQRSGLSTSIFDPTISWKTSP